jgi:hypothetical protein
VKFRSPIMEAVLLELEQHLAQQHLFVVPEGNEIAEAALGGPAMRPIVKLSPDVERTTDALTSIREQVRTGQPLFVIPPWDIKPREGGMTPLVKFISSVCTALPEHPLTVLVPATFLRSRQPKDRVAAFRMTPYAIIGLEELGGEFGIHRHFSIGLVHLQSDAEATRFCKFDGTADVGDVADDLRRLFGRGGGQTRYGFVRRPAVAVDQPLWPDFWSPQLASKLDDISLVGKTLPLQAFAEIMTLVHRSRDGADLGDGGIPMLSGRSISRDGEVRVGEEAPSIHVDDQRRLRPGDILIRALQDLQRGPLVTAVVGPEHLPATSDQTVLVVRPHADQDPLRVEFLVSFLRSATAQAILRARSSSSHLLINDLSDLPIPVPDEATRTAIAQLRTIRQQLQVWGDEADAAIDELLQFAGRGTAQARTRLFALSSTSQRRVAAASLADDPAWQARTLYPHPIAFCLRTVEASRPDLEGYHECLRSAEMILAFLAQSILAVLRTEEDLRLPYEDVIRDRLLQRHEVRLSMGDYLQVVRQFSGRQSREFARLQRWIPLEEIRENYTDDIDRIATALKDRRDSQAHFRDESDYAQAHAEAQAELAALAGSLRFLTDYSLRYIERVQIDTFADATTYDYRDLAGDHPLVPLQRGERHQGTIESGSLYLRDLRGKMHLLRPFMLRAACPTCGRPATFHLDTYSGAKAAYRSFEHGHTLDGKNQLGALQSIGLIPSA